ncbi:rubrerythrin-like domain-containing protein [Halorubrum lipolyticum]|nr:rubrerythrin-like domain-containing protein [Halorubrum lipolyticum]
MRPESETHGREVYECFKCGARSESDGTCECGGELQHLGRSRDL